MFIILVGQLFFRMIYHFSGTAFRSRNQRFIILVGHHFSGKGLYIAIDYPGDSKSVTCTSARLKNPLLKFPEHSKNIASRLACGAPMPREADSSTFQTNTELLINETISEMESERPTL